MIKCFVTMCMLANPTMCTPPVEVQPADVHPIASPMECLKGGIIYFAQGPVKTRSPEDGLPIQTAQWFPKVSSKMYGDGSDIVPRWVEAEKRRLKALEPQIK